MWSQFEINSFQMAQVLLVICEIEIFVRIQLASFIDMSWPKEYFPTHRTNENRSSQLYYIYISFVLSFTC